MNDPNEYRSYRVPTEIGGLFDHGLPIEKRLNALLRLKQLRMPINDKAALTDYLLRDSSYSIRFWATLHLSGLGTLTPENYLIQAVHSQDRLMEKAALSSLAKIVGDRAIPILIKRIDSGDKDRAYHALGVLSRLQSQKARELLRHFLFNHPDQSFRFYTALYLTYSGQHDGVASLLRCLENGFNEGSSVLERDAMQTAAIFALSLAGNRIALAQLRSIVNGLQSIKRIKRATLMFLFRSRLHLNGTDETVITLARGWVNAKLNEGQNGKKR